MSVSTAEETQDRDPTVQHERLLSAICESYGCSRTDHLKLVIANSGHPRTKMLCRGCRKEHWGTTS